MAAPKSAFSRSTWLMKTEREMFIFSASFHSFVVMTCGPSTASTTNMAISAAYIVAMVSPMKSG